MSGTSTGGESFSLLICLDHTMQTCIAKCLCSYRDDCICANIWAKPMPMIGKSPLSVSVYRFKTPFLSLPFVEGL